MNVGKSLFWRVMQQYSVYIIKLLVQVILGRLLNPEEFGLIGIVIAFTSIAEIIATSGLGVALVQKLKPDREDYATVFTVSEGLALVIYIVLFFSAPVIADFYNQSRLIIILRTYGIVIFLQSYLVVINAYVQKEFKFKKSFVGNLAAVIISGIISVVVAYNGAGVWALVIYGLSYALIAIIIIQIILRWHPSLGFDFEKFMKLVSFSWKVLVSSLIGSLLENIYNLTIGRYYGEKVLGYYKQGNTYPDAILGQTRTAFGAVMLPLYASLQNDRDSLKVSINKMTHIVTVVIFPMAFGLAAIAESFVAVVLTEKWLPAVFFMRLECAFFGTLPITTSLGNALISIGRSDVSAQIELSKLFTTIFCVLLFHNLGVGFLCTARVIIAVLFVFISAFVSHRIIGVSFKDLFFSFLKPLVLSGIMGISVYLVSFIGLGYSVTFIIQLLVGISVYGFASLLFMKEDVMYIKKIISQKGR